MKIIKTIWDYIRPKSIQEQHEFYLSKSTDMADLERRIQALDRPRPAFTGGVYR
jgi:hypothetical protein